MEIDQAGVNFLEPSLVLEQFEWAFVCVCAWRRGRGWGMLV